MPEMKRGYLLFRTKDEAKHAPVKSDWFTPLRYTFITPDVSKRIADYRAIPSLYK